jgi:GH15 family glucan-1,4-alpha-glucosidase
LLDGLAAHVDAGHRFDRGTQRWIVRMADLVAERWAQPDHGIWEVRGEPRHYVHSKVWCWVALERAERLVRRLGVPASTAAWQQAREAIARVVLKSGYSAARRSFVQVLGGTKLDAAALTFSPAGFIDGRDPRMSSTIAAVQKVLGRGPLIYRYLIGKEAGPPEGAFLPCSFWLAEALAMAGRRQEAEDLMERLDGASNDVGLYGEEMRPEDGAALGNFPLALTHAAHLSARLRLDEA